MLFIVRQPVSILAKMYKQDPRPRDFRHVVCIT